MAPVKISPYYTRNVKTHIKNFEKFTQFSHARTIAAVRCMYYKS